MRIAVDTDAPRHRAGITPAAIVHPQGREEDAVSAPVRPTQRPEPLLRA